MRLTHATVGSNKYDLVPIMITVGVVCLFLIGISNANLAQILPSFAKQFRAPIPLPIFYEVSKDIKANLTKESSLNNLFLSWIDKNPYEKMFLLLIEDQWMPNSSGNIEINQQIYLLTSTFEVHEKYTVNNHTMMNKVGHFNNVTFMLEKGLTGIHYKNKRCSSLLCLSISKCFVISILHYLKQHYLYLTSNFLSSKICTE